MGSVPMLALCLVTPRGNFLGSLGRRPGRLAVSQGGIKQYEDSEAALFRELNEEVGLQASDVKILACTGVGCATTCLRGLCASRSQYVSAKTEVVLLQLLSDESRLNVNACNPPEFDAWRWVNYWYPLNQVVAFKREVYRRALKNWRLCGACTHSLHRYAHRATQYCFQEVNAARDLASVLNIIVARVKAVMSTEVCSVYLRDSSGAYVLMATDGLNPDSVGRVRAPSTRG